MKPARALTCAETALARTVFRHGIDYGAVRIYADVGWLRAAITTGNRIYFPATPAGADFAAASAGNQAWLIHELTHVWQHQHGFPLLFGGVLTALCGGYVRRRAYRYPPVAQISTLGCLNMEQQADVLAHYFLAARHNDARYRAQLPQYRRLLRPFFADAHRRCLLPHY